MGLCKYHLLLPKCFFSTWCSLILKLLKGGGASTHGQSSFHESLQALNSMVWWIIYYALLKILQFYCCSLLSSTSSVCHAAQTWQTWQDVKSSALTTFIFFGTIVSHSWYEKDMTLVDWVPHRESYYHTCRRIIKSNPPAQDYRGEF